MPSDVGGVAVPLGLAFAGGVFAAALAARTFSAATFSNRSRCAAGRLSHCSSRLILNSLSAAPSNRFGSSGGAPLASATFARRRRSPSRRRARASATNSSKAVGGFGFAVAAPFVFSSAAFFCAAACRGSEYRKKNRSAITTRALCARAVSPASFLPLSDTFETTRPSTIAGVTVTLPSVFWKKTCFPRSTEASAGSWMWKTVGSSSMPSPSASAASEPITVVPGLRK